MTAPDRQAACPCGSGKKYKSCCLAKDRSRADLRASAVEGHAAIDDVLRVLLPLVESRGEHTIACKLGCFACCNTLVRATYAEAEQIADFLDQPEHAEARARFLQKLAGWRAGAGDSVANLDALLAAASGPGQSLVWEAFRNASQDYLRRGNLCPFNEAGACEIYPVRPTPCRTTYVTGTAEYCTPDRGGEPSAVSAPQLHEAIASSSDRMAKAAARSGIDPRRRALPEFVAERLAARRR